MKFKCKNSYRGFTLIEMLAVLGIIAIIVGTSTVYFHDAILGMKMSSGGSQVSSALSMAQQIASSEGRTVEVRFYRDYDEANPDAAVSDKEFNTIALFRYYQPGEASPSSSGGSNQVLTQSTVVAVGNPIRLATGIVMSSDNSVSTLLGNSTRPSKSIPAKQVSSSGLIDWNFKGASSSDYRGFLIRPEGSSLPVGEKWYVTLAYQSDVERNVSASDLSNFFCVQIDPANGRVITYRPQ